VFDIIPTVDSEVQVTTRYPEINLFSTEKYKTNQYRGRVIKSPYAISNTEFALAANLPSGHRIINLQNIIELEIISGSSRKITQYAKIVHLEVPGSKGTYSVTNQTGRWTCTCPGFQFRRQCKHVQNIDIS